MSKHQPTTNDTIATLRLGMAAAAARGTTDTDERRKAFAKRFGNTVIDLMEAVTRHAGRPEGLSTEDVLRTLAGIIGCTLRATSASLPLDARLDLATELAATIVAQVFER
jgi:hypothetical protein